jgi:hypothetical protein
MPMKKQEFYEKIRKTEENLSPKSDFLDRDEAYLCLTEYAKEGNYEMFEYILDSLLNDYSPYYVANYHFSEEQIIDLMYGEMLIDGSSASTFKEMFDLLRKENVLGSG